MLDNSKPIEQTSHFLSLSSILVASLEGEAHRSHRPCNGLNLSSLKFGLALYPHSICRDLVMLTTTLMILKSTSQQLWPQRACRSHITHFLLNTLGGQAKPTLTSASPPVTASTFEAVDASMNGNPGEEKKRNRVLVRRLTSDFHMNIIWWHFIVLSRSDDKITSVKAWHQQFVLRVQGYQGSDDLSCGKEGVPWKSHRSYWKTMVYRQITLQSYIHLDASAFIPLVNILHTISGISRPHCIHPLLKWMSVRMLMPLCLFLGSLGLLWFVCSSAFA